MPRLKRIDLVNRAVPQIARDVDTKGAKTFLTAFNIAAPNVRCFFVDWVEFLYNVKFFGPEDPPFPKTGLDYDADGNVVSKTVTRAHWTQTGPIRAIIDASIQRVRMPTDGPHIFRHMLTHVAMDTDP